MANRIITISREFGSGGRTIGREVAKKLNIPCYDQELIDKIAEKSGYDKAYIQERGEYTASSSWLGNALAMRDFYGQSDQDKLWAVQRAVILPRPIRAIVAEMDSYAFLRPMAKLFECRCGGGRLMFSTMNLHHLQHHPEGRALLGAIYRYMASEAFQPVQTLTPDWVAGLASIPK